MAIALEVINFIVPRTLIVERYPGGWAQCLEDHRELLGGRVYYDDHLFREGAMGSDGIDILLAEWTERGFQPTHTVNGKVVFKDVCVLDTFFGKSLPCDWVSRVPGVPFLAHKSGEEIGRIAGPEWVRLAAAKRIVSNQLRGIASAS